LIINNLECIVEVNTNIVQLALDDVSAAVVDLGTYESRAGKQPISLMHF
jgi:hypothetical protein